MSSKTEDLECFKTGQLCYVVLRRYKGKGPMRLIAHEASLTPAQGSFGYGYGRHWVINPASLMGLSKSRAKAKAARINGKKGGRPKSKTGEGKV